MSQHLMGQYRCNLREGVGFRFQVYAIAYIQKNSMTVVVGAILRSSPLL